MMRDLCAEIVMMDDGKGERFLGVRSVLIVNPGLILNS